MYKVPLIKNAFINEKETREKLIEFIKSNKPLSMGEYCNTFEIEFSKAQGRRYSVLFNSGGSANLALIQAMKNLNLLKDGDNVGVCALTWSTNVMPIIELGLNPIPIDINLQTLNLDNGNLESQIRNIKALFNTNVLGLMPDYYYIKNLCEEHGVFLIEDNCESLGSVNSYCMAGNAGLASTFSFYVAHHISTIEGGMVCTDSKQLFDMLKIVRANGWDRNLDTESQTKLRSIYSKDEFDLKFTFYDLGYNLRPTEITGYLGYEQLQYLPEIIKRRERNYKIIQDEIMMNDDIIMTEGHEMKVTSAFSNPLIFKHPSLRKKYQKKFTEAGIEIRPIIAGDITLQPFWDKYIGKSYNFFGVRMANNNGFYCGNYPEMTNEELEIIIGAIK